MMIERHVKIAKTTYKSQKTGATDKHTDKTKGRNGTVYRSSIDGDEDIEF